MLCPFAFISIHVYASAYLADYGACIDVDLEQPAAPQLTGLQAAGHLSRPRHTKWNQLFLNVTNQGAFNMAMSEKLVEIIAEAVKEIISKKSFIAYFILSVLLNMIYWFIDLFLFATAFYKQNPIVISIIFVFAISLLWTLLCMMMAIVFQVTRSNSDSIQLQNTELNRGFLLGGLFSFSYLAAYSYVLWRFERKIKMVDVIEIMFFSGLLVYSSFMAAFTWKVYSKKKRRDKSDTEP